MRKILAPRPLAAVVAAGAVVAAAAAALLVPSHAGDGRPEVPPLLVVEAQGLRYEFHLPTGTEAL